MLVIRDLKKSYKTFPVLKGLNMTINKGDVYGFIGKNGCGKTTTMNIICDIISKDSGEVSLGESNEKKKIKIGYLPETPALYNYMNAREYLNFIASCAEYEGDVNARTTEILNAVGLADVGTRRIKGFSRGMNQRLGIGAAIYRDPDLLILDEPTSALDPEGRAEVMSIITKLTRTGTTILLCTHILSDIERVANRIGILSGGVMAIEGTIGEVLQKHTKRTGVTLKLINNDPEKVRILRTHPFVFDSVLNEDAGTFTLYANDNMTAEELSMAVLNAAAEQKIALETFSIERPNIEQVYLSIIGDEKAVIGKGAAV